MVASCATSGEARAAAAKLLADADLLAESEERERLTAALRHQSEQMTAAAATASAASAAEVVREAQRRDAEQKAQQELLDLTRTRVAELFAQNEQLQTEQRASQRAVAEATRVSQALRERAEAAEKGRAELEAAAEAAAAVVASEAQRRNKEQEQARKREEAHQAQQQQQEAQILQLSQQLAAAKAAAPRSEPAARVAESEEREVGAPMLVMEAPAVEPASPPAAAGPKPTAPTADRADPAEEPPASSGRAEEQQSGGIPSDFASKLLNDPSYTRPLPGSDARKGKPLPRIAPEKLHLLEKLLVDLHQVLATLLPAQPQLVEEGMRLAMDYLTKGGGAACASPWESYAKVSCTWTARVYCM